MESLTEIINKLQSALAVVGNYESVDLPYIVLLGAESSGKTSVLESILGKSFLPRGTGGVTRTPVVVKMVKYSNKEKQSLINNTDRSNITEWVEFLHKHGKVYHDGKAVRDEIVSRMNYLVGVKKDIFQIVLTIFNQLCDLTFVDLPGLPAGDQLSNDDKQILKMIVSYAKSSNSIILVVLPADTNPFTCESLKLAKNLDPEGTRTIVVVTKLDLIDEDMMDLLCGQIVSVKLGIIGVVNRNLNYLNDKTPLYTVKSTEKSFLKANYPEIYKKHGVRVLIHTLQSVLVTHVKQMYLKQLPVGLEETKHLLVNKLHALQTPDNKMLFVVNLLKDIGKLFENMINGNQDIVSFNEIIGGASIARIIDLKYLKMIDSIDPLRDLSRDNVMTVLLNTSGAYKYTSINEKALQKIVHKLIKNLLKPSLDCVDLVHNEMLNMFDSIDIHCLDTLKRFPLLNEYVRKSFKKVLEKHVNSVKTLIASYIEIYQECLDTTNQDFIFEVEKLNSKMLDDYNCLQGTECLNSAIDNPSAGPIQSLKTNRVYSSEDDETETVEYDEEFDEGSQHSECNDNMAQTHKFEIFKKLLSGIRDDENKTSMMPKYIKLHRDLADCYFRYVRKNVRDFVPKSIKHTMMNLFVKDFDKRLCTEVFQTFENHIDQILLEEHSVLEDKKETETRLDAVNEALKNMLDIQYF